MTKWIWILALALVAGCSKDPVASARTDNPNVKVETLFTHDGCTVYRFLDSNYHYFARCDSGRASVSETHVRPCGKGCTRTDVETIPTEQR